MIGSYRRLAASGIEPIPAVAIGRTVHEQKDPMIEWREGEIETERTPVDWSELLSKGGLLPNTVKLRRLVDEQYGQSVPATPRPAGRTRSRSPAAGNEAE
jgi:hypothetical protein